MNYLKFPLSCQTLCIKINVRENREHYFISVIFFSLFDEDILCQFKFPEIWIATHMYVCLCVSLCISKHVTTHNHVYLCKEYTYKIFPHFYVRKC